MAAEAGYLPDAADHVTPHQISIAVEAHFNNQVHDMRQTREIIYTIAAANRDPKKSFPTIEKFRPLPGDPKQKKDTRDSKSVIEQHMAKKAKQNA